MQALAEAARQIQANTPWYEKVGLVWNGEAGNGRDVAISALIASNITSNAFTAANETVLSPVFIGVKGLLDAMHGAAAAREEVVELIQFCVAITRGLLDMASTNDFPPTALMTVGEFKGEMDAVGAFVQTYHTTQTGCCWKISTHSRDRDTIAGHKRRLEYLLTTITASPIRETQRAVRDFDKRLDNIVPPRLDKLAAVPCAAPSLPRSHVPRTSMIEQIVSGLRGPERETVLGLVGMGGGGKTVLASSVVRDERVRSSFSHGIFWVCVGHAGKDNVALLLEQLARELAAARSDTPHVCPHSFDTAEDTARHLKETLVRGQLRCLLVLDNVWDVEVVAAFMGMGFNLLVTTRQRTAIAPAHEGTMVKIGDMSQEEALQVLGKASGAQGPLPVEAEQVGARVDGKVSA